LHAGRAAQCERIVDRLMEIEKIIPPEIVEAD